MGYIPAVYPVPLEYYEIGSSKTIGKVPRSRNCNTGDFENGMTKEEWANKKPTSWKEAREIYKNLKEELEPVVINIKLPEIDWKKHWATGKKYYKTCKPFIINKYAPWVVLGIIFFIRLIQFSGG